MRVPINMATQPLESLRPLRAAVTAAAVSVLLLTAILIRREVLNRNEFRAQTDRIQKLSGDNLALQREQEQLQTWMGTPEVEQIRQRSAFLNSIILQKSLSWTRMFLDLEKTLPAEARITAIRPSINDTQDAELNLTVAADTMPPLIEFLKNLEASPQFGAYAISSQRYPSPKSPQNGIQMDLTTRYRPAPESQPAEDNQEPLQPPADSQARAINVPLNGAEVLR